MSDDTLGNDGRRSPARRLFDIINRHRLKLAALIVGFALLILLADAVLKGSAY